MNFKDLLDWAEECNMTITNEKDLALFVEGIIHEVINAAYNLDVSEYVRWSDVEDAQESLGKQMRQWAKNNGLYQD